MPRKLLSAFAFCCFVPVLATAQQAPAAKTASKDPRVDKLTAQVVQLQHTVADQERRLAELETTVKALEAIVNPLPQPIPAPTPQWHSPQSWNQIRPGMSEAEVVALLGTPTRVLSVTDTRTLYYQPDPRSRSTLQGSITLQDDRVTASSPPAF